MCPLSSISSRAAEIERKAPVSSTVPGLAEQRVEEIAFLRKGVPAVEFANIPGFYSFPSTSPGRARYSPMGRGYSMLTQCDRPAGSRCEVRVILRDPHPALLARHDPCHFLGPARAACN